MIVIESLFLHFSDIISEPVHLYMNMFCALLHVKLVCFQTTSTDVTLGGVVIVTNEPGLNPALDPLHESHKALYLWFLFHAYWSPAVILRENLHRAEFACVYLRRLRDFYCLF